MIVHTPSGHKVNLRAPSEDSIEITDIAHNLARINRFNGATNIPYSVASHSVWVSKVVPEEQALSGLLHDASEAYLGDIIAPLKPMLQDYNYLEARFDLLISKVFGVHIGMLTPDELRKADSAAALLELFALGHPAYEERKTRIQNLNPVYLKQPIVPQSVEAAEKDFMERFNELTEGK